MNFEFNRCQCNDTAQISYLRKFMGLMLNQLNVQEIDINDVNFILSEICSNVVRHSQASEYKVKWNYDDQKLIIIVIDDGIGFDKLLILEEGSEREDGRIGGFGIPLIEQMADRVEFSTTDPHGTTVTVHKKISFAA